MQPLVPTGEWEGSFALPAFLTYKIGSGEALTDLARIQGDKGYTPFSVPSVTNTTCPSVANFTKHFCPLLLSTWPLPHLPHPQAKQWG